MNFSDLKAIFNNCEFENEKIVISSDLHEFLKILKEIYGYNILSEIIAVDKQPEIELLYKLFSEKDEEFVIVSITVKNEAESVTDLFPSAIADENEIYDLFGINFMGHADLKRLYMTENWKGHPLRKDYKEDDERLEWNEQD